MQGLHVSRNVHVGVGTGVVVGGMTEVVSGIDRVSVPVREREDDRDSDSDAVKVLVASFVGVRLVSVLV
jgi:hypothetical protein